jgi:hypothetical protein
MPTPKFKPLRSRTRRTRWIKSPFSYENLRDKRVFAQFTTQRGQSYEGTGKIRVNRNREGKLAVDLVFTRVDSPYQFTDIIFHLSSRQATHLRRAPDGVEYHFVYQGHLAPDNQPHTA